MPIEIADLIARIGADTSGVTTGMARVKAAMAEAGVSAEQMGAKVDAANASIVTSTERASALRLEAIERAAKGEQSIWAAEVEARWAADASMMASFEANQVRMTAAAAAGAAKQKAILSGLGSAFAGLSAGIAIAGGLAIKAAADFDGSMTKVANNAGLTNRELASMKAAVLGLGKESGANLDDLAAGFLHVHNFGFQGADAVNVLRVAMESAVATGAKTADTANILAGAMKNMHIPVSEAGAAMNVLHLASQRGNMTLDQFNAAASKAFPVAAAYHVSLTEVSSALSAMTQHQIPANQAATNFNGIIKAIISPTTAAEKALIAASKASGVDLVHDFTNAGLATKGLKGIIDDLNAATNNHAELLIKKLVPATRGQIGMVVLAKEGYKDFTSTLAQTNEAMAGKLDPTTKNYQRSLAQLQTQMARLWNEVKSDFIPVGEQLAHIISDAIPFVKGLAEALATALGWFAQLPRPIQDVTFAIGLAAAATRGLGLAMGVSFRDMALVKGIKTIALEILGLRTAAAEATVAVEGMATAETVAGAAGGTGLLARLAGLGIGAAGGVAAGGALVAGAGLYGGAKLWERNSEARMAALQADTPAMQTIHAMRNVTVPFRRDHPGWYGSVPLGANYAETLDEGDTALAGRTSQKLFGTHDLASLTAKQWDQIAGTISAGAHKLAAAFAQSVSGAINTPEGQASCAFFASQLLDSMGAHVGKVGGAKALRDKVVAEGGHARASQAAAQAGDLVVWQGSRYGANGSGYHVGVYLGNGRVEESSGNGPGHQKTSPMYDRAHASFYSVPGVTGASSSVPSWLSAMSDPMTAETAKAAKERAKESEKALGQERKANDAADKIDRAILKMKEMIAKDLADQDKRLVGGANAAYRIDQAIQNAKDMVAKDLEAQARKDEAAGAHRDTVSRLRIEDMDAGPEKTAGLKGLLAQTQSRAAFADLSGTYEEQERYLTEILRLKREIASTEKEQNAGFGEGLKGFFSAGTESITKGYEDAFKSAKTESDYQKLLGDTLLQYSEKAKVAKTATDYYALALKQLHLETADLLTAQKDADVRQVATAMQQSDQRALTNRLTDDLAKHRQALTKASDAASYYQQVLAHLNLTQKDLTPTQAGLVKQIALMEQLKPIIDGARQVIGSAFDHAFSLGGDPAGRIQDRTQLADLQRQQRQLNQSQQDRAYILGQRGVSGGTAEAAAEYKGEQDRLQQQINATQRAISGSALTIGNVFKTLWSDITTGFQQMLIKMAEDWLKSQIMNALTGILSKVLGFAIPGAPAPAAPGAGAALASGGDVSAAGFSDLTANAGATSLFKAAAPTPGLILSRPSGAVSSNPTVTTGQSGGAVHNHYNFTIVTPDANSFKRSQGQIMQDASRHADSFRRRNGTG